MCQKNNVYLKYDELKILGHAVCNFCDEKIVDVGKMREDEQCCDDMNLIKYIGMNVC